MVNSIAVPCCLITSNKIEGEYVYKLIKTIFSNIEYLQKLQEKDIEFSKGLKTQELTEISKTKDGKIIKTKYDFSYDKRSNFWYM